MGPHSYEEPFRHIVAQRYAVISQLFDTRYRNDDYRRGGREETGKGDHGRSEGNRRKESPGEALEEKKRR